LVFVRAKLDKDISQILNGNNKTNEEIEKVEYSIGKDVKSESFSHPLLLR
jgi:hypothetical protein